MRRDNYYLMGLVGFILCILCILVLGATLPPPILHTKTTTNDVEGIQGTAVSINFAASNNFAAVQTFMGIWPTTNAWAGPTNTLSLNGASWGYYTVTPVQINDFLYPLGTPACPAAVLQVYNNNAGSNVTAYLPPSVITDDGQLSYIISNKTTLFISFQVCYGFTNAVVRLFPSGTVASTVTITENFFTMDQHFSGKVTINQLILTNGFFAQTNVWGGPSNNVDVSIYDQEYASLTPCQFNGIINNSNYLGGEVKMTIGNISSSNITVTFKDAGFKDSAGLPTSETITNGHRGIFWINQDPALGGQTNVVFQHF